MFSTAVVSSSVGLPPLEYAEFKTHTWKHTAEASGAWMAPHVSSPYFLPQHTLCLVGRPRSPLPPYPCFPRVSLLLATPVISLGCCVNGPGTGRGNKAPQPGWFRQQKFNRAQVWRPGSRRSSCWRVCCCCSQSLREGSAPGLSPGLAHGLLLPGAPDIVFGLCTFSLFPGCSFYKGTRYIGLGTCLCSPSWLN